ncbi:MAG: DUF6602 domain-containing protein [Leptolyngbyaceae cyanobacterium]
MTHPHYQRLIESRIKAVIDKSKAHDKIPHAGLKGYFRELLVKELMQPLLLNNVGVAKGQIIDHSGGTSPECDVVLYHKNVISRYGIKSRGVQRLVK